MTAPREYFRAAAGVVITDGKGNVLALERSDVPGAWQFPQGGLEAGEEPRAAALREVEEETGLSAGVLEFVDEYPEPLVYELPRETRSAKMGRGQVQYWFLFRFTGNDDAIDLEPGGEFTAWRWMKMKELVSTVAAFRRRTYEKLEAYFAHELAG